MTLGQTILNNFNVIHISMSDEPRTNIKQVKISYRMSIRSDVKYKGDKRNIDRCFAFFSILIEQMNYYGDFMKKMNDV
jgi:hypothetical protein